MNKNKKATSRGLYTACCTATPKYRSTTYGPSFNHILIFIVIFMKEFATTKCIGLNVELRSMLLISYNRTVYITYKIYITAMKMAVLGRNVLTE
jgi:hypothetical protein